MLGLCGLEGPEGDHGLDAERLELGNHALWIGPARRVEGPVSLMDPVVVINHNNTNREAAVDIAVRNLEELRLVAVAVLALDESCGEVGHLLQREKKIRM